MNIRKILVSALLCITLIMVPLDAHASSVFLGSATLIGDTHAMMLRNSINPGTSTTLDIANYYVNYTDTIGIDLEKNKVYNGILYFRVNLEKSSSNVGLNGVSDISISLLDSNSNSNVSTYFKVVSNNGYGASYDIGIVFNDYTSAYEGTHFFTFPISVEANFMYESAAMGSSSNYIILSRSGSDYVSDITYADVVSENNNLFNILEYWITDLESHLSNLSADINDNIDSLESNINSKLDSVSNNITSSISNLQSNMILWFSNLNNNVSSKFESLFQKMDEDQEEIINGYDPSTGNNADQAFNNSTADLEAAEDSLFNSTSYDQVDYDQFNDFFSLTGITGALAFIKSCLESMYSALGIFGIPITLGLILLIATRIFGYQRFSSGGG